MNDPQKPTTTSSRHRGSTNTRSLVQITKNPTMKLPTMLMESVPKGKTGAEFFGREPADQVSQVSADNCGDGYSEKVFHDGAPYKNGSDFVGVISPAHRHAGGYGELHRRTYFVPQGKSRGHQQPVTSISPCYVPRSAARPPKLQMVIADCYLTSSAPPDTVPTLSAAPPARRSCPIR